ncbi:hypothetical protein NKH77_40695 [Streptomyces sp. M19]
MNAKKIIQTVGADTLDPGVEREAVGFLTVIVETLDAASFKPREVVDPKYFFPMMPRTDFVSMRRSLSSEAAEWLTGNLQGVYRAIGAIGNRGIDGPLFPGRYKEKPRDPVPTRREWLDSVFTANPAAAKDLLSPPPGYPRHEDTEEPEGIGAMKPTTRACPLRTARPGWHVGGGTLDPAGRAHRPDGRRGDR